MEPKPVEVPRPRRLRPITEPVWYLKRTGTGRSFIETAPTASSDLAHRPRARSGLPTLEHIRFAVIGAGRLGAGLALALRQRGAHLTGFLCATPAGRDRGQSLLHLPAAAEVAELVASHPSHYILSVPDAVLPGVADALAVALPPAADGPITASVKPAAVPGPVGSGTLASGQAASATVVPEPVVLHTSGATSVSILSASAEKGALTLVFHPLQTFSDPLTGPKRLAGAAVAVTPAQGPHAAKAAEAGFLLARGLGARPFLLADDKRDLYHAAASLASNYLVTLEHCARELFALAGMPREEALPLFLPLAEAALANVRAQGPVFALTGPLSRGDEATISGHIEALGSHAPHLLPLYRELGFLTLDLVRERGELAPAHIDRLARLLGR